jgi:hypothetical protein
VNNELKQQGDGAGETSRTTNYELQGTGWAGETSRTTNFNDLLLLTACMLTYIHYIRVCIYLNSPMFSSNNAFK